MTRRNHLDLAQPTLMRTNEMMPGPTSHESTRVNPNELSAARLRLLYSAPIHRISKHASLSSPSYLYAYPLRPGYPQIAPTRGFYR